MLHYLDLNERNIYLRGQEEAGINLSNSKEILMKIGRKNGKMFSLVGLFLGLIVITGCVEQKDHVEKQPFTEIPKGILVSEIPESMDIIFSSIRYVLDDVACLDENYELKNNFINDPQCNRKIYNPDNGLASPRQLFALDMETGNVIQITNTECCFINGQVVDTTTVMCNAACADTDNDGMITDRDKTELYLLDLTTGEMNCLTCECGLDAINNADYSCVSKKIVFSARKGPDMSYPHHIYTIDFEKNVVELTDDAEYMDFDCSWSEDGSKIVFNRLPSPWLEKPSQVWMMDSDGSNLEKITEGGKNPNNEGPQRGYPIGIDADPDLSPDNKKIVFSRLKTGEENGLFGIYELVTIDVDTKEEHILDSSYANMVPEWKSRGILFVRQIGALDPTDLKQSLYVYRNGEFVELEKFPYNVFPIGAYGGSWIERECAHKFDWKWILLGMVHIFLCFRYLPTCKCL